MNLEVEETGPVERKLRIEIPTTDVDAAFEGVYRELGKKARIRGFRPGKVPRSVVEKYYGEQARSEVLERLVHETLPKALKDAELIPVVEPRLEPPGTPNEGEAFAYEATIEIRPTIELKQVKGLSVKRPQLPEPEQDPVEQHLEELRLGQGQLLDEPEGTSASRGHFVVIQYKAQLEGQPPDKNKGEETTLELGGGQSLPGFEDELVGMVTDQERDFELSLPAGDPESQEPPKSAAFHVKLIAVKRRELPELDDEFAKDVSEFATLQELRDDLAQRVRAGRETEQKRLLREAVVAALIEANPFPVPEGLISRQLANRIGRAASQLHKQLPEEQLGRMIASWREEWRPQAERDVRLALLVPEIAKAQEIEVSAEDVDEHLRRVAEERGRSLSALKRSYREQGLLDALEGGLLEERVVEFLVSEATLSGT